MRWNPSSSTDVKQRYCANLGHVQDDEAQTVVNNVPQGDGLIYMRARFYEPWTGRFISQDPDRDGPNYFAYAANDSVNKVEYSGKVVLTFIKAILQALLFFMGQALLDQWTESANQISRLTKYISEMESLLAAGSNASGDVMDLVQLRRDLNANKATLNRAKWIKGGQAVF